MAHLSKAVGDYFSDFIKKIDKKLEHNFHQNKIEKEERERAQTESFLKWVEEMAKYENTPSTVKSITQNVACLGIGLITLSALTYFLVKIDFHM